MGIMDSDPAGYSVRMPQELAPTPTAADYARLSLSPATLRAYRADWADFTAWCQGRGVSPLPAAPNTVADYLASLALTHGRSALKRRLSAIGQAHRLKEAAWIPSHPLIRHALRGILRQHGRPTRKAAALATADIKKLVVTCDQGLTGQRDRAMLLVGLPPHSAGLSWSGLSASTSPSRQRACVSICRVRRATRKGRVPRSASRVVRRRTPAQCERWSDGSR